MGIYILQVYRLVQKTCVSDVPLPIKRWVFPLTLIRLEQKAYISNPYRTYNGEGSRRQIDKDGERYLPK